MDGGAKVPGNLTADKISLGTKFQMSGIGDGMANDEWLRMVNPADPTKYAGGFAAQKIWTQSMLLNGDLKADGIVNFGGGGATGFQWGNEGGNGWSCLDH